MGLTQGIVSFVPPQGRLTLTTATPVLTATVSAAGTVFYTPYQGAFIPVYDGANLVMAQFAELSNILANSATGNAGPAAAANNSNYDLFVWNNAGTLTLTRGPLWTSDTARGTGAGTTELVMVSGILLNANAITNGPAAQRGTYVGTIRTNGTATTDFNFGNVAAGATAALLNVWNCYNRVSVLAVVGDSNAAWTYSSNVARAVNGNNNMRVSLVRGLIEDAIDVSYQCKVQSPTTATAFFNIGIGLDATNSLGSMIGTMEGGIAAVNFQTMHIRRLGIGGTLGFHFYQATEQGDNTNTFTLGGNGENQLSAILRA